MDIWVEEQISGRSFSLAWPTLLLTDQTTVIFYQHFVFSWMVSCIHFTKMEHFSCAKRKMQCTFIYFETRCNWMASSTDSHSHWHIIYWFIQCLIVFDWRFRCSWHFNCGNVCSEFFVFVFETAAKVIFRGFKSFQMCSNNNNTSWSWCLFIGTHCPCFHAPSIKFQILIRVYWAIWWAQHSTPYNV